MSNQRTEPEFEQTYTQVAKQLHFSIESIPSQIASYELETAMGAYMAYKVAIDRLDSAVSESGTQGYAQVLSEADKNANKLRRKILEAIALSQAELDSLPEAIKKEIADELGLSYLTSEPTEEPDKVEGLEESEDSSDTADNKADYKEEVDTFFEKQSERAKRLEQNLDIGSVTSKTKEMNAIALELEQQIAATTASSTQSGTPEVPDAFRDEQIHKRLKKVLEEEVYTPKSDEDDVFIAND